MKHTPFTRIITTALLAAYLATGILSPTCLLSQSSFFKLDNSITFRNDRSIALDERPYWTSHKHLISSEQFSNDHILGAAAPWINAADTGETVASHAIILPAASTSFSSNALRAPPLS